ncbi:MAG TPA: glycosyltransferase family 2 protein [Chlamydiales bacterium]|nr:glycosyltransferase family 2 protein [Chlamydiales bacterium]
MGIIRCCLFFLVGGSLHAHFITFIIPCFNCEPWIEQTVASIYHQNLHFPFEIVCTDDGSVDHTWKVLLSLAQQHPEMRVYQHEKNRGGAAARNTCVFNSSGDLIFCLDSDNVLEPNSVPLLIDSLDATHSDVVAFQTLRYFSGNRKEEGKCVYQQADFRFTLKDILEHSDSPPCSGNYLYTRASFDAAKGYPEGNVLDTFSFGFRQLVAGAKMIFVPGTFYWHRVGTESYFIRESRTGRLHHHFFQCVREFKELFTDASIALIEAEYAKGNGAMDYTEVLSKKMLKLK